MVADQSFTPPPKKKKKTSQSVFGDVVGKAEAACSRFIYYMIFSDGFLLYPGSFQTPPLVKGPDHHISFKQCEQLDSLEAGLGVGGSKVLHDVWVLPLPFLRGSKVYTR